MPATRRRQQQHRVQGTPPQATGAILTLSGEVVAEATVECESR